MDQQESARVRRGHLLPIAALMAVFTLSATQAAAQVACDAVPLVGCLQSAKAKFSLHDDPVKDNKNKVIWSFVRGDNATFEDLGDPTATDAFSVCLYDGRAGVPELIMEQQVLAGANWRTQANNGFGFGDRSRVQDGVQILRVAAGRGGAPGPSKLKVVARGDLIPFLELGKLPNSALTMMATDPSVIVQLVNTSGTCWSNEFSSPPVRNTNKAYRAKFP
jgi:hypothetical protein